MSALYLNKEIMNYYKELKKIKYDVELLRKIGLELGYRKDTLENFVLSSKGNFSKILKFNKLNINFGNILTNLRACGIILLSIEEALFAGGFRLFEGWLQAKRNSVLAGIQNAVWLST